MISPKDGDTICAVATPPGLGGISVLRISGARALELTRRLAPFLPFSAVSHQAYFGVLIDPDSNEQLDEVILTFFEKGRSFTGEETVEISCHGNPLICAEILKSLVKLGARPADRGEFTYRAFMNGRIDLVQAESVLALIESRSQGARRLALRQLQGGLSGALESIEDRLIWCLAHIEAGIDFATEGLETVDPAILQDRLSSIHFELEALVKSFSSGRAVQDGVRIAFLGRPNVGKSSLLNNFLEEDRAIVTEIPGTTRDVIEGETVFEGLRLRFLDTAGVRDASDQIERIGIERSHRAQEEADMVFFVIDAQSGFRHEDRAVLAQVQAKKVIFLVNKVDGCSVDDVSALREGLLAENFFKDSIERVQNLFFVSALDKSTRVQVLGPLIDRIRSELNESTAVLSNARHYERLLIGLRAVERGLRILVGQEGPEFAAVDLKEALLSIQETLGKRFDDQIMDRVFKEFCIGK